MSDLDHSELRTAARSLSVALERFEVGIRNPSLEAYREAKEQLVSAARCVVLAESVLLAQEGTLDEELAHRAAVERECAEADHADDLGEVFREDGAP